MTAFSAMWQALQPIGRDPATGGYRRYAWTRTDHDLREWFAAECAGRGLDLVEDRMGNQWAWWGDPDAAGTGVVTGSHLDSVPDGGGVRRAARRGRRARRGGRAAGAGLPSGPADRRGQLRR